MKYELIGDFELEQVYFNGRYYTPGFEIYKSKKGLLAWSNCKDGDVHINQLKGVTIDSSTEVDMARIIAERLKFELKTTDISPESVLKENRDLVSRMFSNVKKHQTKR